MIWAFAVVAAIAVLIVVFRSRRSTFSSSASEVFRAKAAMLPPTERVQMAEDIRAMALEGYDRLSLAAKDAGKSDQFANEGGVLDAVYCVLANSNDKRADASLRPSLQMEGVPFNHLEPDLARAAVAEYLVWKFLPNSADQNILRRAFSEFRAVMLAKADSDDDPTLNKLLQGDEYDWQKLLRLTSAESEGNIDA